MIAGFGVDALLVVALWLVCIVAGVIFYAVPTALERRRRRRAQLVAAQLVAVAAYRAAAGAQPVARAGVSPTVEEPPAVGSPA